ncbi:MAG: hypothetical protein VX966_00085 [Chloroflexota bacterium]|nr:hypothetical protein [Chloroflexota bacterium]
MEENTELTREVFQYVLGQSGLKPDLVHDEELFKYVRNVLAGMGQLADLKVGESEPPTAFRPGQEY